MCSCLYLNKDEETCWCDISLHPERTHVRWSYRPSNASHPTNSIQLCINNSFAPFAVQQNKSQKDVVHARQKERNGGVTFKKF